MHSFSMALPTHLQEESRTEPLVLLSTSNIEGKENRGGKQDRSSLCTSRFEKWLVHVDLLLKLQYAQIK